MLRLVTSVVIALALAGCATSNTRPSQLARTELVNAAGSAVGTAVLTRTGNETVINLTIKGTPGAVHGLHLHAVGKCEAPFTSAGPHLNPGGRQHGHDNPLGAHLGDLPNVSIGQNGICTASSSLCSYAAAIDAALFDAD